MKKVLLSLAAASAIAAVATPAAADHDRYGMSPERLINQRERQLDRHIDAAAHRRQITVFEARRLTQELRQIERLERHYRRHGLSRWEFNDLNARLDRLQYQLRVDRRDDDRRRYGYAPGLSFSLGLGQRW